MEVAEALRPVQQLDASFNDDPTWFLRAVTYVDRRELFDQLLIRYQADINAEALPTAAQHRAMITDVQNGKPGSDHTLVDNHWGLIASVAYPFKTGALEPQALLCEGARALVQAAKTYDEAASPDFSDYAASTIHAALGGIMPELAGDSFIGLPERPMEAVYQFMENVQPVEKPEDLQRTQKRAADREARKLKPEELAVVPLLDLKAKDIAVATGKSMRTTQKWISSVKAKFGAKTVEGAVLAAMERGVKFNALYIPDRTAFSIEERKLAMRLDKPNRTLMKRLGFGEKKLESLMRSLYEKTGAKTRAQILIVARTYDLEPTKKELNPPTPTLVERLEPMQKDILRRAVTMTYREISEQPDVNMSKSSIEYLARTLIRELDLPNHNKTALFLELYRQGMEFYVPEPERPLSDLLFRHELEIARLMHLPREEILKAKPVTAFLGTDANPERIGDILDGVMAKVGASSVSELALMVAIYDDGSEALELDHSNHKWRLAQQLGLKTLEAAKVERLLLATTKKQERAIRAYHLADGAPTWDEAAASIHLKKQTAQSLATRGIRGMRQQLEDERAVLA